MDKVTEQIINQLRYEIDVLKGQVTQLSGELARKVNKDDIISQINISSEVVRISADKIHFK